MSTLARWASKGGAYTLTLTREGPYHFYSAKHRGGGFAGGSLGPMPSDDAAIAAMQVQVDTGRFQPDKAKSPMRRVP